MTIDLPTLLYVLYAFVAVMVMIVLYHLIFIVVNIRKITKTFENVTDQVEETILKPISIADQGFQWVMEFLQQKSKHSHKKHAPIDVDKE